MGQCPRYALASKFCAVSHGHMDHIGGLAYWCSQRKFQGMGVGKIVCDERIAPAIDRMMAGFVDLERQKTPYEIIKVQPGQDLQIKNGIFMRPFLTEHTAPSMGFSLIEKRSKLKPEYMELPQEKLRELKDRGIEITRTMEIPLICYVGDTAPGPHLIRDEVRKAQIVLGECTFFEPDHKDRAKIGMHMHVSDVAEWLRVLECQHLVLIHVSRRTDMQAAKKHFVQLVGEERAEKVMFLMDHKTNRLRYEKQAMEAEALAAQHAAASGKKQYPEVVGEETEE